MGDETLRNRTDAKLRYARLHIGELGRKPPGRGHDFERAHQEATLAHLFGAYAALFQELNLYLGCNLKPEDVTLGKMNKALKKRGATNPLLTELHELEKNPNSWFRHAKDMRDQLHTRVWYPISTLRWWTSGWHHCFYKPENV